jgi:tetratricopeptide (TPR) repeat protein
MIEPQAKAQPQPASADPAETLRRAAAHHRRGELPEAATLYRQVLDAQPDNFDALHLTGVIMQQRGRFEEALALIDAALAVHAKSAAAHGNRGLVLAALGRHAEALAAYDRALTLRPDYPEALNNRGNTLRALGRAEAALADFARAIALRPDYAEALNNRGNAFAELGRLEAALAAYQASLDYRPAYTDALLNRGQTLLRLQRPEQALASLERALALDPNNGAAHLNRGNVLRMLGRDDDALAAYARALALKPNDADILMARGNLFYAKRRFADALDQYERAIMARADFAEAHNNRGNALSELGRGPEALEAFGRALALKPGYAEAYCNRGNAQIALNRLSAALVDYDRALALKPDDAGTLVNRGSALRHLHRRDEARASFDKAIALNPDLAEAYWNRALASLSFGDFAQGWPDYEWRWRRQHSEMIPRDFAQPQWRGEDLHGRTILLHAEQGYGDTIQFIRYLPMVLARGGKVVLEIPDDLRRLLALPAGVIATVRRGDMLPPFDVHCPLLSLPLAFATTLATIPPPADFLRAPAERIDRWRTRVPRDGGPRIGLVWSGKPSHKNDHNRSIPLALLAPLLTQPGFQFVGLQKEYRDADRAELTRFPALLRLGEALGDFADTAAVMAALDLVIAVDTAVAHLAGTLGKPVWILLPAIGDWRWMVDREHSPWYESARLMRQPQIGDWPSVIVRLGRELATFAQNCVGTA